MIKYMLTFVFVHCCNLQSIPRLSLCNKSSVSATDGSTTVTNILELHVEWLTTVLNFRDILETTPF
jgi:hypothetical protein